LGVEVKLNKEIVVDVASIEIALVGTDGCRNVFLFSMLGLVNIRISIFSNHRALLEL
jgi:hypothetical protein